MKQLLITAALLLSATASAHSEEVRSFDKTFDAKGFERLSVEIPVGEVEIEGTSSSEISVEVAINCTGWRSSRCEEYAEDVDLVSSEWKDKIELEIEGLKKWRSIGLSFDIRMRAPAGMELEVDVGVGEVEISGFTNDVAADLGVGELSVSLEESQVRSVDLETGLGEANFRYSEGQMEASGLFGNEVRWDEGNGKASVKLEVGVGEIDLRLKR
jgi:hypothetical protein